MDPIYQEAAKRVKNKKKFFNSLYLYIGVSLLLIFTNIFTNPNYLWFLWAIVPWGITILLAGVKLIIDDKQRGWEQKQLRKEIKAMGGNPDEYLEKPLDLPELDTQDPLPNERGYRDSDLV